jgi:hypothetical protein
VFSVVKGFRKPEPQRKHGGKTLSTVFPQL